MSEPDTSPVFIRPAGLADDAALGELDRATWSTLHAVLPRPMPPYEPFFDEAHRPDGYLVAETAAETAAETVAETIPDDAASANAQTDDGDTGRRIAGYIRLGFPTPLACNQHVRQIQGLAVAGWARGRGVARALLRAAGDEARRQGAVRITLRVLGHNTPARRLYESEGYVVEGILPGEFFLAGRYVDDVLMGRSITP
ncbi:N-acetyltransferase [Streptomyces sp. NPDC002133]|uniref:GNAT family N-acetyltransferase n=1 Tax=Streptomyces sp. NPDC002133 TaxID=3154409 RepID=UPI003317B1CF